MGWSKAMNTKEVTVRAVRRLDTARERVFDAWFDAQRAGEWLFATASGQMVQIEIDARVNGGFLFVDRRDGVEVRHLGQYLEILRPERIGFTFCVPQYSVLATRVVIDILPRPLGCELILTHAGVLPEYSGATQAGWRQILDGLARTLGVD